MRAFLFLRYFIEFWTSQICDGINDNVPDQQVLNHLLAL